MRYLAFILILLITFGACKKDAKLPNGNVPSTTNDTTQVDTTSVDSNIVVLTHADSLAMFGDSCYAHFVIGQNFSLSYNNSLVLSPYNPPIAIFYDSLNSIYNPATFFSKYVGDGNILCNHVPMYFQYPEGYQALYSTPYIMPPCTWETIGNDTIGSFTFTHNVNYPFYAGYVEMPDTIDVNNGFSMTITGLTGQSLVQVSMNDDYHNPIIKYYRTRESSLNISFSSAEMSVLQSPHIGAFGVGLLRDTTVLINQQPYYFAVSREVSTQVWLK